MLKSKKAGCSSYANVSDDYILYNKSVKPVSGGRKSKGGNFLSSLPSAFNDATAAINKMKIGGNGGCSSCSSRGGSRGGARGGAVELAPFAASLAFLATRMAVDKELNFNKILGMKKKTSSSKTSKSASSRSRKSV